MSPAKSNGKTSGQVKAQRGNDEFDELLPPIPPDGGWGWVVVGASFLTNLIVDGVCYTFGIIMPELLTYFQSSNGKTALVGSMVPGVYLIVGELLAFFKYSALSAAVSYFSQSVYLQVLLMSSLNKKSLAA